MKKKIALILIVSFALSVMTVGTAAGAQIHPNYDPGEDIEATVSGDASVPKGDNKDESSSSDENIGTDFYIVDYQDTVNTYQLKVEVPMYVSLAVVGDGEVAVPSANAYGLRNFSGYPVNVTTVTVDDQAGGWNLSNSPVAPKDISVSLEGKNLIKLDDGSESLSQIEKATTLDGAYHPYAITANAFPSNDAAQKGYQFTVSYTLELDK